MIKKILIGVVSLIKALLALKIIIGGAVEK